MMSKKQKEILWPMLLGMSVLLALTLVSARTRLRERTPTEISGSSVPSKAFESASSTLANEPTKPQSVVRHEPVQVVDFTVYDAGIYPREEQVSAGLIAIAIEDMSGGTAGLVVQRERAGVFEQVGYVGRDQQHFRGRLELRLTPGRYRILDATRPNNRALLIVEP